MRTGFKGRDLITTQEWSREEIDTVIDVALDLKRKRALGEKHAYLDDKVLAMLFFFPSTRTRASFHQGCAGTVQLKPQKDFSTSSSSPPGWWRVKAMRLPSGDQAGALASVQPKRRDSLLPSWSMR